MPDVLGIDFGQWNTTVFWIVEYLKSSYGEHCVYPLPAMGELRAAHYPPRPAHAPAPLQCPQAYGVFLRIVPHADQAPQAVRPNLAAANPDQMPIDDPGLPALIQKWFDDARP